MPVVGPILKKQIDLNEYQLPTKNTQMPVKQVYIREIDYEDENLRYN